MIAVGFIGGFWFGVIVMSLIAAERNAPAQFDPQHRERVGFRPRGAQLLQASKSAPRRQGPGRVTTRR